jgi:hypothetical protein
MYMTGANERELLRRHLGDREDDRKRQKHSAVLTKADVGSKTATMKSRVDHLYAMEKDIGA